MLPVIVVEKVDEKKESSGSCRFCTENLLPTGGSEFTKYSNNTGYWDADSLNETLLRFTKYTHNATHGYIIVTDLQGVCKGNTYHLTDPVILCKDILCFGNTNLGETFIKKCIDSTKAHLNENGWVCVDGWDGLRFYVDNSMFRCMYSVATSTICSVEDFICNGKNS